MSISVWPGYVAAVASLLLSLLLLAGVLVVSMSQVGRVVSAYNKQLLSAVAEDERRQIELERVRAELAKKTAAASQSLRPAEALPAGSLQALESQLRLKSAEVANAESQWLGLQSQMRQLATPPREGSPLRTYRFVFGAGAQGLDAQAIKALAAALRAQESSLTSGWLLEAGVKGLDAVLSREIFRLMLDVRDQLRDIGLKTEQVRVMLHQDRATLDTPGQAGPPLAAGEVVILLRAEPGRRP